MNTYKEQPAFEIHTPDEGKKYKIWADGRIEGFGDGHLNIINRIAPLLHVTRGLIIKSRDNGLITTEQAASLLS